MGLVGLVGRLVGCCLIGIGLFGHWFEVVVVVHCLEGIRLLFSNQID